LLGDFFKTAKSGIAQAVKLFGIGKTPFDRLPQPLPKILAQRRKNVLSDLFLIILSHVTGDHSDLVRRPGAFG
jgi:hypothetical protein